MAHLSHCYHDGASLYFTYALVRDPERPVEQWLTIKRAASEAILEAGGTISHHHGVGEDHLPWMPHEKGPIGQSLLRTLKQQMDPQGVLNPGKLIAP
jgi:alkyldihydroxyacetonephosphate synthase